MMDKPNYVLKANEGVLVPDETKSTIRKLKKAVWIIVGIIILGSLIFQDNLFGELSWTTIFLLIALILNFSLKKTNKMIPQPFEIQFYDDYLIVYREKNYYSPKLSRKEYFKIYYKDVKEYKYRANSKKINIIGFCEINWYDYNKDGSLPDKPTIHKKTEGICWFYTSESPEVDFVSEIERHSPLKVTIRES